MWANEQVRLPDEALDWRGQRAIGVVYRPEFEWYGSYVPTVLPRRYDALIYVDQSHALQPLHMRPRPREEAPETFPPFNCTLYEVSVTPRARPSRTRRAC